MLTRAGIPFGAIGMSYLLTRSEVATQIDGIRSQADEVCAGLDEVRLNWQPDAGRRWSIAQCLDHLARTTDLYGQRLEEAIAGAATGEERESASANLMGRFLIWSMEPPSRVRMPTKPALQPPSALNGPDVLRAFGESLDYLSRLTASALRVDASHVRYRNPLAGDTQMFNLATGVLVMLAHNRRHLEQAEKVRRHRDFPAGAGSA
jgi:hypothetical protein